MVRSADVIFFKEIRNFFKEIRNFFKEIRNFFQINFQTLFPLHIFETEYDQ